MIICLRPQPDCDADVAELTRRAVQSVALPMLQVAYLSGPPVLFSSANQPGDYQGIIMWYHGPTSIDFDWAGGSA